MNTRTFIWLIFSVFSLIVQAEAQKSCMDSIQLIQFESPVEKANYLIRKGNKLIKIKDDSEQARNLFDEAMLIGEKEENQAIILQVKIGLANALHAEGNYEESVSILEKIIPTLEETSILYASAQQIQGTNEVKLGNHAKAYEAQLIALKIFQDAKDKGNIADTHFGIGTNFFYQKQYGLALDEYKKALAIWEKKGCKKGLYRAYRALGGCYGYLKQLDKAYRYTKMSLDIAISLDNQSDISWTLLNMGATAHDMGDNKEALKNFIAAKKIAVELGKKPLQSYALEGITVVYKEEGKFDQALLALNESFAIASSNNDRGTISGFYKLYADIYFELGNTDSYKSYIEKHIALKDSMFNDQLASNIGSLKKSFEMQELEQKKKIELLEKDGEIYRVRGMMWGSIISGVALISILFLIFFRYRNKHMAKMNEMLHVKNEQILQQNEKLVASNKDLGKYAYIISHDLKEPLRNISSFTTLLNRKLPKNSHPDIYEYMSFINNGVNQMHILLTDLLEYSKINGKSKKIKKIDTNRVVKEVVDNLNYKIQETQAVIQVDTLPDIYFDQSQFIQIVQNLIANALKFKGEQDPLIEVSCKSDDVQHLFRIKDNGIGINEEFHEKIFVVFQRLHNRAEYKGSGIGLSTCKKIINEYGGKIWVESKEGEGCTFCFTILKKAADPIELPEEQKEIDTSVSADHLTSAHHLN